MDNDYTCPRCGRKMKFNARNNTLACRFVFCGIHRPLAVYLLSPDVEITLGMTKTNGLVNFFINSQTKKFAIEVDRLNNSYQGVCNFGPFDIDKLLSVQILDNESIVYENKNSGIPMLAGGFLFGAIGAVAGSMISNQKQSVRSKTSYTLILKIDNIHIPSFYIETDDNDLIFKFVNAIELLRPKSEISE